MIFDNNPLEGLTKENDLFGLYEKAELILSLFNKSPTLSQKNKMFAIYGGWGTGKTTLLKFLEKNLDDKKYYPVFFEAWQNEKDDNLALSLADAINAELMSDSKAQKIGKKFVKISKTFFKGFAKGTTVRLSLPFVNLNYSPKDLINEFEDSLKPKEEGKTYSQSLTEFKNSFNRLENKIIEENELDTDGRIIVFIDDLDRCEPENVLNLISALKLFFTYGEKTVFVCGIDKHAISKAVKSKYLDVIKASEYLEKIFDITFNLPSQSSPKKIFEVYFRNQHQIHKDLDLSSVLNRFLKTIDFVNPRHIKKILNKYSLINTLKALNNIDSSIKPIHKPSNYNGYVIDTLFIMYALILKEYYPSAYSSVNDINQRVFHFTKIYHGNVHKDNTNASKFYDSHEKIKRILRTMFKTVKVRDYIRYRYLLEAKSPFNNITKDDHLRRTSLYWLLLPLPRPSVWLLEPKTDDKLLDQFFDSDHQILVRFCRYLMLNLEALSGFDEYESGDFTMHGLFTFLDKMT